MRDHELYAAILGVQLPWQVTGVALDPKAEEVRVVIEAKAGTRFPCPKCQSPCPGYDTRRRGVKARLVGATLSSAKRSHPWVPGKVQ